MCGYRIEFNDKWLGYQPQVPSIAHFDSQTSRRISASISELISFGVVQECKFELGQFLSPIFLVSKPDSTYRKILNLKRFNEFVTYEHFKMENLASLCDILSHGCYMTSIDLRKAYYSVSIRESDRKYLRFQWQDKLYEYTCLAMGLSSAPRIFTRLMKVLFTSFREQGVQCVFYLDDSVIVHQSAESCLSNTSSAIDSLKAAGFHINYKKSVLQPCQRIKFLGFVVDSVSMLILLPDDKVQKLRSMCSELLSAITITIERLSQVIGFIVSCLPAFPYGKLHYRSLEIVKIEGLRTGNYFSLVSLTVSAKNDLSWWLHNASSSGKPVRAPAIDIELYTDACLSGYGAVLGSQKISSPWTVDEKSTYGHSINCLEMLAVYLAIKSFGSELRARSVCVRCDNTTAVAYINNMGGTHALLCNELAKQIWQIAIDLQITLVASHIPGVDNTEADLASRATVNMDIEMMLDNDVFKAICNHFHVKPDIDLFASRLNYQVACYAAWKPDPGAAYIDAFLLDWSMFKTVYIFPPFSLWGRLLPHIQKYRGIVQIIVVYPEWKGQYWFPKLSATIAESFKLPAGCISLPPPHRMDRKFQLCAGRI
mgnify:FL=1